MDSEQSFNVIIDEAVKLQCKIRGLSEEDVKQVVLDALCGGFSEGDGTGRFVCKGSVGPGRYVFAWYKARSDGAIVILEVFAM